MKMLNRERHQIGLGLLVLLVAGDLYHMSGAIQTTQRSIPTRRSLRQAEQQDQAPDTTQTINIGSAGGGQSFQPDSAAAAHLQQQLSNLIENTLGAGSGSNNGARPVRPTGTAPTVDQVNGRKLQQNVGHISKEGVPLALPPPPQLSDATKVKSKDFKIAIVNDVNYHHEVTAGVIWAMREYLGQLTVFVDQEVYDKSPWNFGYFDYFTELQPKYVVAGEYLPRYYDLVIFVSPEFSIHYTRYFVFKTQPNVAVMIIHEAHGPYVDDIANIAPHTFMVTLSPHVSVALSRRYGKPTWWALPSWEVKCNHTCSDKHDCYYKGFVVQGKFEYGRRNYGSLWEQMMELRAKDPAMLEKVRITAVGLGNPEDLRMPQEVSDRVHYHTLVPYQEFYTYLCQSLTLLPLFSPVGRYLTEKISSTVITSLMAAVPMIVHPRFVETYSYFGNNTLYLTPTPDKGEMEVMISILKGDIAELHKVRANLASLRGELNQRAADLFIAMTALDWDYLNQVQVQ